MTTSLETFLLIAPEIALVVAALVVFLSGAFANLQSGWPVAVAGIAIAMFLSGGTPDDGGTVTSGPVSIDGFSLGVRWLVLKTPVEASPAQLSQFGKRYPMNARPTQPLNGRVIEESK